MIRPRIRRLFRLPLRRRDLLHEDVEDEIRLHLALRAEQLVRDGLSADDARREAQRRFGSLDEATRTLEQSATRRERHMHAHEWIDELRQDVRYALRLLGRQPAFAVFVMTTLALGIGANAAMFGVVDRLLLRGPEHVRDVDRVRRIFATSNVPGIGEFTTATMGYVTYLGLRGNTHGFERVAAYSASQVTIGRGGTSQRVPFAAATADFFPLLGVRPLLGRFYTAEEDRTSGADRVTVLGYGLWRRQFAGDRAVVGKTIVVDDETFTIVGVAPEAFTGADLSPIDLWIPLSITSAKVTSGFTTSWNAQWLQVVARLRPGASDRQASADASAARRRFYDGKDRNDAATRLFVAPLAANNQGKASDESAVTRWLVGVAAIVLLIACANVANLLLARAVRRRREVAVRLALGAGRGRLIRLLLMESVVLAIGGGALGLLVARWTGQAVRAALLPNIEWASSPVSLRVLGVSAVLTLATGVLIGLVPAIQATNPSLTPALKAGTRQGGHQRSRMRGVLTIAQAALSVVLLIGAGLFVRSLWKVRNLDLGFQPDRVLIVGLDWQRLGTFPKGAQRDRERARRRDFYLRALDSVRMLREVEAAGLAVGTPLQTSFGVDLRVPGWDSIPKMKGGGPYSSAVSEGYFSSVGTGLKRGRVFTRYDRAGSERVAIVSESMAETLWPHGDPLGQCLLIGDDSIPCARIVGVVADAHRFKIREEPAMHYYVPFGQESGIGGTAVLVRPRGDLSALVEPLRRVMRALDPDLRYVDVRPLQESIEPQVRPWKLGATVFGIFGVLALAVAAIGLYSVISYVVAQRTHEIGVRIALGARTGEIVRIIVKQGLGSALAGVAIGIALALVAGRFIERLLFDTSPRDLPVFIGVAAALLIVATIASLIPAWRVRNVDPVEALRTE